MRTLLALATVALAMAALSGCTSNSTTDAGSEPTPAAFQEPLFASEPDQGTPAGGSGGSHGQPQRDDGQVETGMTPTQVPGAYARQTVTITNDFGGASDGIVVVDASAGAIQVQSADRDGYLVEATLEVRAATEVDARAMLERSHFLHTDDLAGTVLTLTDKVEVDRAADGLPTDPWVRVGLPQPTLVVTLVITVPVGPAIDLTASAASGGLSVSDVHGPSLDLSTASGSISGTNLAMDDATVSTASGSVDLDNLVGGTLDASTSSGSITATKLVVPDVEASTSSGSIDLAGAIDDLDASSSSGSIQVDAQPAASGTYDLSSASGSIEVKLPSDGHAYHVEAGTSSGSIDVDIPGAKTLDDGKRHVEVATPGYEDAALATEVDADTSSGNIDVSSK